MTSGELGKLLAVSDQTIRNWSDRLAAFLSPEAAPPSEGSGPRPVRHYTPEDGAALALVAEMRRAARGYDEIAAALEAGQRGELPPGASEGAAGSWEGAELPPAPVLLVELRTAQIELKHALADRERLAGELAEERKARLDALERAARAEGRLEEREARGRESEAPSPPVEPQRGSVEAQPAERPRSLWERLTGRGS